MYIAFRAFELAGIKNEEYELFLWGPVRRGTHVPWMKFATSHVGISQDSYVACRNFVPEELCREIWPCSIKTKLHV